MQCNGTKSRGGKEAFPCQANFPIPSWQISVKWQMTRWTGTRKMIRCVLSPVMNHCIWSLNIVFWVTSIPGWVADSQLSKSAILPSLQINGSSFFICSIAIWEKWAESQAESMLLLFASPADECKITVLEDWNSNPVQHSDLFWLASIAKVLSSNLHKGNWCLKLWEEQSVT